MSPDLPRGSSLHPSSWFRWSSAYFFSPQPHHQTFLVGTGTADRFTKLFAAEFLRILGSWMTHIPWGFMCHQRAVLSQRCSLRFLFSNLSEKLRTQYLVGSENCWALCEIHLFRQHPQHTCALYPICSHSYVANAQQKSHDSFWDLPCDSGRVLSGHSGRATPLPRSHGPVLDCE